MAWKKTNKKVVKGKSYSYDFLVESYRDATGKVKHRYISNVSGKSAASVKDEEKRIEAKRKKRKPVKQLTKKKSSKKK